jgi:hypothetical protein
MSRHSSPVRRPPAGPMRYTARLNPMEAMPAEAPREEIRSAVWRAWRKERSASAAGGHCAEGELVAFWVAGAVGGFGVRHWRVGEG